MQALGSLGRRREQRCSEVLRLAQADGENKSADLPGAAIVFPGRARQIAPYHTLNRQWFSLVHEHAATVQYIAIRPACLWIVLGIDRHQMIAYQPLGALEPKAGELGENFPLAGDASWQHNVEDRDAIGRHDQQS